MYNPIHNPRPSNKIDMLREVMLDGNLRVSEALAIRYCDIDTLGRVYLKAGKGGLWIAFRSHVLGLFMEGRDRKNSNRIFEFDRFHVYREFKKLGISYNKLGNTNTSITHAHRHQVAKYIRENDLPNELITSALNHKSKKSQEHYGT